MGPLHWTPAFLGFNANSNIGPHHSMINWLYANMHALLLTLGFFGGPTTHKTQYTLFLFSWKPLSWWIWWNQYVVQMQRVSVICQWLLFSDPWFRTLWKQFCLTFSLLYILWWAWQFREHFFYNYIQYWCLYQTILQVDDFFKVVLTDHQPPTSDFLTVQMCHQNSVICDTKFDTKTAWFAI